METQRRFVSTWQLITILISSMIGVGILSLPRTVTTKLHEMGWVAPVIGGVIAIFPLMAILYLSKEYPGLTFVEYSPRILGKSGSPKLGRLLCYPWMFLFFSFQFLNAAMVARGFGEVVVTAVLLETPLEATLIGLFLIVLFLCMHEIDVLVRVNELLFPIMLIPIFLVPYVSLTAADWNNLLPIHIESWSDALKAGINTFSLYTGYELLLVYYGLVIPGAKIGLATWFGLVFTIVSYALTAVAGIVVFGYEELQLMIWPTLEMVKTAQRTGWFLERLESAFLAIWVASVFTTLGNMYYTTIYGLRLWFGKGIRFQRITALVLIIPFFYVTLLPQNIVQFFAYAQYLTHFGYVVSIGLPILLALIHWLRKQNVEVQEADSKKGGT
ncbi:GerAB/ArcD/ProY family transporter [Brevibacillus choshinensis]|uniref:Endospore germination permease n=1 Tax=Brevibacillus choshinensis TaxID=54911 RepID=A0ABX7FUE7_BRECH|nr:endospore germination permease [Brevibacillus choshinensis]QRG69252.1 endospore germination permease [Brevibacillus choshinensis]